MDLDKNGRITPYIVGQVMKQYGWNLKPYELVVRVVNRNIDLKDNIYYFCTVYQRFKHAFNYFSIKKMISDVDDDDNGYITLEEFIPLMGQVVHEDKYLEDEITELFLHFGKERNLLTSDELVSKLLIASNGVLSLG